VLARRPQVDILVVEQGHRELDLALTARAGEVWDVSRPVLAKLSQLKEPPSMLAVVAVQPRPVDLSVPAPVIVLDDVQDPGNVGTIIRGAAAFGFPRLVLGGESVRLGNRKCLRAAQAAVLDLEWEYATHCADFLARARAAGLAIYTTAAAAGSRSIPMAEVRMPAAIVFGSEGRGVDPALLAAFPSIRIDQSRAVESLNVGVAACILMYELGKRSSGCQATAI
jgi:RNA methyltransferase, TrmH family